jgi:hypothetical protein
MRTILASLVILVLGGPALAEPADEPPPPPTAPSSNGAFTGERVVLPVKRAYARAMLEIELSKDTAFDPVSLAPDVFYGVTPEFTAGLVHSASGATGIIGGTGSSLCFTDACDVYNGFGLDGRYHFKSGTVAVAANFGLYANNIDPFQLALKLGLIGRYRSRPSSKLAVDFAPALFIGITEREPSAIGATGNKEVFVMPVTVLYTVMPRLAAMAQLGLVIPFENADDLYAVPFSIGASYAVNKQITVEGAFSLQRLLGGDGGGGGAMGAPGLPTGADARSFTIGGGYAF